MSEVHVITNQTAFITELRNSLIPELNQLREQLSKDFQPKQPVEFLTRAEVCELLKIDLSTLHRWRKDNIISSYAMGNRVYFKRTELEQTINQNKIG